jgi:response regulator NasT
MMNKPILWLDEELDPKPSLSLVNGYRNCTCIRTEVELRRALPVASAIIVYTAYTKLRDRQTTIIHMRRLPILWLCTEARIPRDKEWGHILDGLLFPGMERYEVDWALHCASHSFSERKRWYEEKEQLLQRLEERKWVDQAKAILCEIKGITESEAYDFLRKQAMNERKRTGEVAASIVKVYQLIHG